MDSDDHIYIGDKPTMNYVSVVAARLNGESSRAIIKARGRLISKAVDVALITMDRFVQNCKTQDIGIKTEVLECDEGGQKNVSTIMICLQRAPDAPSGSTE